MTTIRAAANPAAALERLRLAEPFAVDGASVEDMTGGCELLDVLDAAGMEAGAVAVELVGRVATITCAAGRADAPEVLRMLEEAARRAGATHMRIVTRRPGLVRNLTRDGYAIAACELTKDL